MNNSENYKVKYLRYKRDYLSLKEELEGGAPSFLSQAVLYIILDVETYNLITTIIKRSILSIQFMDTILTGSAIKMVAGSNAILFLKNEEKNMVSKQLSRRSSALVGISLPEYKMIPTMQPTSQPTTKSSKKSTVKSTKLDNYIGNTTEPYSLGSVYNTSIFINQISNIIKEKLVKRNPNIKKNVNNINIYDPIIFSETLLPFYGIFLFEADSANCHFIEAYKLEKSDATDLENNNTVATLQEGLNVHLVKDNSIFNLQSPFMSIMNPVSDTSKKM